MDRLEHGYWIDVVGDDRVCVLTNAAYDGWDVQIVCIAMKLITEIMIWYLFIRVCISDFNEYVNRKIRKTFNLE